MLLFPALDGKTGKKGMVGVGVCWVEARWSCGRVHLMRLVVVVKLLLFFAVLVSLFAA